MSTIKSVSIHEYYHMYRCMRVFQVSESVVVCTNVRSFARVQNFVCLCMNIVELI